MTYKRTNQITQNRHASSSPVNKVHDAGALAPVVFSGDQNLRSCKISQIKGKGGPYPPKSRAANTMVVSVCPESAWKTRYDTDNQNCPNNGEPCFLRASWHEMVQTWSNTCPEYKQTHKNNYQRMNLRNRKSRGYQIGAGCMERFRGSGLDVRDGFDPWESLGDVWVAGMDWNLLKSKIRISNFWEKFWQSKGCVWS